MVALIYRAQNIELVNAGYRLWLQRTGRAIREGWSKLQLGGWDGSLFSVHSV